MRKVASLLLWLGWVGDLFAWPCVLVYLVYLGDLVDDVVRQGGVSDLGHCALVWGGGLGLGCWVLLPWSLGPRWGVVSMVRGLVGVVCVGCLTVAWCGGAVGLVWGVQGCCPW